MKLLPSRHSPFTSPPHLFSPDSSSIRPNGRRRRLRIPRSRSSHPSDSVPPGHNPSLCSLLLSNPPFLLVSADSFPLASQSASPFTATPGSYTSPQNDHVAPIFPFISSSFPPPVLAPPFILSLEESKVAARGFRLYFPRTLPCLFLLFASCPRGAYERLYFALAPPCFSPVSLPCFHTPPPFSLSLFPSDFFPAAHLSSR